MEQSLQAGKDGAFLSLQCFFPICLRLRPRLHALPVLVDGQRKLFIGPLPLGGLSPEGLLKLLIGPGMKNLPEDFAPLLCFRQEQLEKLPLRQHGHPGKLGSVQPHNPLYGLGHLPGSCDGGPAIGVGQLGIRLFCDPLVPPFGWAEVLRVAMNHIVCLLAAEGEFHIGRCVLGSIGAAEHGSFPVGSAGLAIEGKGNAVKQGGLPRSGFAGDKVQTSVPQPSKVHRHRFSIRAEGGQR